MLAVSATQLPSRACRAAISSHVKRRVPSVNVGSVRSNGNIEVEDDCCGADDKDVEGEEEEEE